MKEISVKIDDELYRRASQKVSDLEAEVNQRLTEYIESVSGDDDDVVATRVRMAELFAATKNFGVVLRPSRNEMHEPRSSL